eukprot:Blabericola_migrator_1__13160@NODE_900_length_6144_cov_117_164061_g630_i0_p2_GENE_NODE_900_length_6144_cov_117_164061_g630_i0NODE_900_length_6144_cov_117_164061_g630_i0_p2_ORF_typecomplete_len360_score39_34IMCp/PF12314_8/0_8_NODE_900_length_6144_cov_117_164061_g630_i028573936
MEPSRSPQTIQELNELLPERHRARTYKANLTVLPDEHVRTEETQTQGCLVTERHIVVRQDPTASTDCLQLNETVTPGFSRSEPGLHNQHCSSGSRRPPSSANHVPERVYSHVVPQATETKRDTRAPTRATIPRTFGAPPQAMSQIPVLHDLEDECFLKPEQALSGSVFKGDIEVPVYDIKVIPKYVDVPVKVQKVVQRKKVIKKYVQRPILIPIEEVVYQDVPQVERRTVYQDGELKMCAIVTRSPCAFRSSYLDREAIHPPGAQRHYRQSEEESLLFILTHFTTSVNLVWIRTGRRDFDDTTSVNLVWIRTGRSDFDDSTRSTSDTDTKGTTNKVIRSFKQPQRQRAQRQPLPHQLIF